MNPVRQSALAAIAVVAALGAQQAPFRSSVESIRVDVLVTKDGQPVIGLGPDSFEVMDNGVRQLIDAVTSEDAPVTVILALDASMSVAGNRLQSLRQAGSALLDDFRPADEAGLIVFSHKVVLGASLTSNVGDVRKALDTVVNPQGRTSLIDAAYAGIALADSTPGRALLILLSDGIETSSWLGPGAAIEACKRGNVVVYPVTTAASVPSFLEDLAGESGGRALQIRSEQGIQDAFLQILKEFRQRYFLSYTPKAPIAAGWHDIRVRVSTRNVKVQARRGYLR